MSFAREPAAVVVQPVPVTGYGELLTGSLTLVLGVMALAIVLVGGARWLGRRAASGRGRARWMEVVARLPLEPRRSLYVVRVREQTLLLGTSEQGVTLLRELPPETSPAQGSGELEVDEASGGFAALVQRAASRLRARRAPEGAGQAVPAAASEPVEQVPVAPVVPVVPAVPAVSEGR